MTDKFNILVAEKEPFASQIKKILTGNFPCVVKIVPSCSGLEQNLASNTFHLVITATDLKGCLDQLGRITAAYPELLLLPAIADENYRHIGRAAALNLNNYLSKPYIDEEVLVMVKKSLTIIQARKKATIKKSAESDSFHGMIGSCGRMKKLFTLISRIADDEFATVLIRGESGTGKELVARAIHQHSQRKNRNFVPVNCAAIPDDLLESELFGHTKGAFTGASQNKQGRIQYADGGTLFLDEIGDMKGNLQAKLLRVLQEKEFEPIGALKPVPVNTRILAATHCDLEQMVEAGEFREDLYYRLSVIPLHIPALRERSGDLKLLIDHFIHKFTTKRGKKTFHFTEEAYTCLQNHRWRGNVRELENLVQHMSILYDGQSVNQADLPEKYQDDRGKTATPPPSPAALGVQPHERFTLQNEPEPSPEVSWDKGQVDFKQLINDFETGLILQALKMTGGNKKEAAALLNLKRTTLLEKIKKKELDEQLWRQ